VLAAVGAEPAILWWVLAVAIAYSRVYLGVHYPLDVAVGGLVGLACGVVSMTVVRWSALVRSFKTLG
jgi:undecaprenyl-diphosphatase